MVTTGQLTLTTDTQAMAQSRRIPLADLDAIDAWKPWSPDAANPWTLKWAGHLYRRAAFAAPWSELRAALPEGPEATLQKLIAGGEGHEAFDELMDSIAPLTTPYAPQQPANDELPKWWLHRMIGTLHPFQERMTLFWHSHFATSIVKVMQPALMLKQNFLLRKHALGEFQPFLQEMSRDPAMLIWLDSDSNVKGAPNENYARELMELFSLGVGHYTETDVREAARAFTGWHTSARQPAFNPNRAAPEFSFNRYAHDDGPKTVLGQTGRWDGGDIVRIVLEQPAAARFLVRKLYRHFISEQEVPPDRLLEPLADQFRKSDYDIGNLMRTILRSRHFFSDYAYRQRVKSPVEYLVGMLRSLEIELQPAGPRDSLALALERMGQFLFAPPNVKGWDGGTAWLNATTFLARQNLATQVIQTVHGSNASAASPAALVLQHVDRSSYAKQIDFLLDWLLQPGDGGADEHTRKRLVAFLAKDEPQSGILERRLCEMAHTILLLPDYQLA